MFVAEKTKILPVYTIYKYNPEVYRLVITLEINNQITSLQVLDLKVFHEELAADLVFFMKKTISYYNRYCSIEPILKERNKINLIQRNI
jgi:hypothetical protein